MRAEEEKEVPMGRLDERELREAVDLHVKAYQLLKWMEGAMDRGFISPSSASAHMNTAATVEAWLVEHILNLPEDCRPSIDNRKELEAFCNLFSTFLTTSFDIIREPGMQLWSEGAHCFCPMCSFLKKAPHVRPKKVRPFDKSRARKLMVDTLRQLCIEENLEYPSDDFAALLKNPALREDAALLAHAAQIVRRSLGMTCGPELLALWREFAWTRHGSPKKNFVYSADLVLSAKARLIAYLGNCSKTKNKDFYPKR